jgi:hypothetical protein
MAPLAETARADAVGAGRCLGAVFEPVDKGVEGADGRGLEGGKASDLREARMGAQVVGPLGQTLLVQQQHEQKGSQETDRVVGRPTARARSIEGPQERAGRVEIKAQEHQGGLVPGRGQAARLAAQPTLELGGQGCAILGMR